MTPCCTRSRLKIIFLRPPSSCSRPDRYALPWFTPRSEVRLCGRATPASAYVILNRLQAGFQTVRFETRLSGALTVSKEREKFAMNFPAMFGDNCAHPPEALIQGLGPGPRPSKLLPVNSPCFAVCETQAAIQTSVLIPSGGRNFIHYCRGNGTRRG